MLLFAHLVIISGSELHRKVPTTSPGVLGFQIFLTSQYSCVPKYTAFILLNILNGKFSNHNVFLNIKDHTNVVFIYA